MKAEEKEMSIETQRHLSTVKIEAFEGIRDYELLKYRIGISKVHYDPVIDRVWIEHSGEWDFSKAEGYANQDNLLVIK
jgi:hypothetical protein